MPNYLYKFNTGAVLEHDVWESASHDELRILVYLLTRPDGAEEDEITEAVAAPKPRVKASLSLWREAGVILREDTQKTPTRDHLTPKVELEFEERPNVLSVDEIDSLSAAKSIRDESLGELMSDVASLLSKPALNTYEAKHVAAAYEQYGVSVEYILTLATYMSEEAARKEKRFTTKMLSDTVARLVGRGVDTLEALEAWIEAGSSGAEFYELRRVFAIWSRALSKTEIKYFRSWTEELGYGIAIIDEARDVAIQSTGKQSLPYINKLLLSWHAEGLKTVSDIEASREKHRLAKEAEKPAQPKKAKKTAKTPEYSDFNSEDALLRALERSYNDDSDNG